MKSKEEMELEVAKLSAMVAKMVGGKEDYSRFQQQATRVLQDINQLFLRIDILENEKAARENREIQVPSWVLAR